MMADRISLETVDDDENAMAFIPHLPNDVIHNILGYLPTKVAIRTSFISKNWLNMWCDLPVIDLEEEKRQDISSLDMDEEHNKFIEFLQGYLALRHKDSPLEKLRLHMFCGSKDETTMVERLLSFGTAKGVKEFDVKLFGNMRFRPSLNIAKTITTLKLQQVDVEGRELQEGISFPLLKTLFLNKVKFKASSFMSLVSRSPSLEHISMNSCFNLSHNFGEKVITFKSSSLKSLELVHCESYSIKVTAENLESFTLLSSDYNVIDEVKLDSCANLNRIKIHARGLDRLELFRCHKSMKAAIDVTQGLKYLSFNGYMTHDVFEEGMKIRSLDKGFVAVQDKPTSESSQHFSALVDFLEKGYASCWRELRLVIYDPKAWTFPEELRKIFSPPLPHLMLLRVIFKFPKEDIADEFWDSLHWMAPNAKIDDFNKKLTLGYI